MPFKLYNSLSRTEEAFAPSDGDTVRMYSCGPTVYNYVHIGNLRTFAFQDVLRRHVRHSGWRLRHVMNITDVEDKIIAAASAAGVPIGEYTAQYVEAFFEDCAHLRLERPEVVPAATDHIPQMIGLVQRIAKAGHAYEVDGSTYFRISGLPSYGKLSRLDSRSVLVGARVDSDEYGKDDARDFVLWKASRKGEPSWHSPFGPGRPGWHLECSAMAMEYLGETFDIHTGGVDLQFPHHENEIAQSESATGKPFARFWVHAEHLLVDGKKMSKSEGNFYTLRDLLDRGHSPDAIRYLLVATPYRKQLNFTFDGLRAAASSIERLRNFARRLEDGYRLPDGEYASAAAARAREQFRDSLDDDLNTAGALGAVFEYVRAANSAMDSGTFGPGNASEGLALLGEFDRIFDVMRPPSAARVARGEVERLVEERAAARRGRNFALADRIRDGLAARGVILRDGPSGTQWHYSE
ncbi:MAG: cysteine--tRNA ligase [Bryobacterales bacterium]|nr:cysteine--tRNA ligase [Bryobacterales bacterium]